MKRTRRNGNLEAGLAAYDKGLKTNDTVAHFFKDRLSNWPIYAAAAGSALALSTSAMAEIVVDPGIHRLVGVAPGVKNFSGATATGLSGLGDVAVFLHFHSQSLTLFQTRSAKGTATVEVADGRMMLDASGGVAPLAKGAPITSGDAAAGRRLLLKGRAFSTFFGNIGGTTARGKFKGFLSGSQPDAGTYAGFILPNGDPGWLKIHVQVLGDSIPDAIEILDWAVATGGESITAGQTGSLACPPFCVGIGPGGGGGTGGTGGGGGTGGTTTIPEPGSLSLSLLAMGSVAVLAWRKMRKERARLNQ